MGFNIVSIDFPFFFFFFFNPQTRPSADPGVPHSNTDLISHRTDVHPDFSDNLSQELFSEVEVKSHAAAESKADAAFALFLNYTIPTFTSQLMLPF